MPAERNLAALSLFKQIVRDLKQHNKNFSRHHPLYAIIYEQMRVHQTTQQIGLKGPNEMQHLAQTFATYLQSHRRMAELNARYCKGERTVEQTAKMVGLELPQQNR